MPISISGYFEDKPDLPKVAAACIMLLAVASTAMILAADSWGSYVFSGGLTAAGTLFLDHIRRAYLRKRDLRGALSLVFMVVVSAMPAIFGVAAYAGAEDASWRSVTIGILWSAAMLCFFQSWKWMEANRRLSKRVEFLDAIGLVDAMTAGDDGHQHRMATQDLVADKINVSTRTLSVLVVNGKDDLSADTSPIYRRLSELAQRGEGPWSHSTRNGVRVLILDPLCAFARERAFHVPHPGIPQEEIEQLYVRNFISTREALKKLGVSWRIYCDRPLYRFYLGTEVDDQQWCVSQTYLRHRHGYQTTTTQYLLNGESHPENCFISLAHQYFEYMWERGFTSYGYDALTDHALVAKLYSMYGPRRSTDRVPEFDEMRRYVAHYARSRFTAAERESPQTDAQSGFDDEAEA